MDALIINFRRGRHTVTGNHAVATIENVDSREKAAELVGKEIVWKSPAGKLLNGKVAAPHGNKGAIRIIWERGMPGQAVGTKAKISA